MSRGASRKKKASQAETKGVAQHTQDAHDRKAAEAYTKFEDTRADLAELVENYWSEDDARQANPFFGLFGGDSKPTRQRYYVTYEDAAGNVRELLVRAGSRTQGRAKAREQLGDDYGSFRGGKFYVEVAN